MSLVDGIILTDSIAYIQEMVTLAMVAELNDRLKSVSPAIQSEIRDNIKTIFLTSPEFKSLLNPNDGELSKHFGIPIADGAKKCAEIFNVLANSVMVEFETLKIVGKTKIDGGINIYAFIDDFSDILGLSAAEVITDKNESLPWLQWLLIEGNRIIINGYYISYSPHYNPESRAGGTLMRKAGKKSPVDNWRVPAQYSGTVDNNWITRAIDSSEKLIEKIIFGAVTRNIRKVVP